MVYTVKSGNNEVVGGVVRSLEARGRRERGKCCSGGVWAEARGGCQRTSLSLVRYCSIVTQR